MCDEELGELSIEPVDGVDYSVKGVVIKPVSFWDKVLIRTPRPVYQVYAWIRKLVQRAIRGFDDEQLWDMEVTFAEWFLPRLDRYLLIDNHYHSPEELADWEKVRRGLELLTDQKKMDAVDLDTADAYVEEALRLFSLRVRGMWT